MNDNEALFSILHDLTELRGEMLQQESTLESQLDSISKLHLESARNLAQRRISSDWRDFATGSVEHNVIDRVDKGAPRWPANSIARTRTCYGWPFASLGTCVVIRFRTNSRIRFDAACPPVLAKPLKRTNEAPRSEAG